MESLPAKLGEEADRNAAIPHSEVQGKGVNSCGCGLLAAGRSRRVLSVAFQRERSPLWSRVGS